MVHTVHTFTRFTGPLWGGFTGFTGFAEVSRFPLARASIDQWVGQAMNPMRHGTT